ncbi:MAG: HAD family hydrolase [archaeon]|nr:HAD family hydrolase [archaeon]
MNDYYSRVNMIRPPSASTAQKPYKYQSYFNGRFIHYDNSQMIPQNQNNYGVNNIPNNGQINYNNPNRRPASSKHFTSNKIRQGSSQSMMYQSHGDLHKDFSNTEKRNNKNTILENSQANINGISMNTLNEKYFSPTYPLNGFGNNSNGNRQIKPQLSSPNFSFQSFFLPPQPANQKRKTLILDLDETLVHSSFKPFAFKPDICLYITVENRTHVVNVLKRPYVNEFLLKMSKLFELIIFTASVPPYANPLLDKLDLNKLISYRLFRQHCISMSRLYIKDLRRVGRDLKDTIILDNNPVSYIANKENGLPILTWHFDKNDRELIKIIPVLEFLAKENDVRNTIKRIVKGNQIDFKEFEMIVSERKTERREEKKEKQKLNIKNKYESKDDFNEEKMENISRNKDFSKTNYIHNRNSSEIINSNNSLSEGKDSFREGEKEYKNNTSNKIILKKNNLIIPTHKKQKIKLNNYLNASINGNQNNSMNMDLSNQSKINPNFQNNINNLNNGIPAKNININIVNQQVSNVYVNEYGNNRSNIKHSSQTNKYKNNSSNFKEREIYFRRTNKEKESENSPFNRTPFEQPVVLNKPFYAQNFSNYDLSNSTIIEKNENKNLNYYQLRGADKTQNQFYGYRNRYSIYEKEKEKEKEYEREKQKENNEYNRYQTGRKERQFSPTRSFIGQSKFDGYNRLLSKSQSKNNNPNNFSLDFYYGGNNFRGYENYNNNYY